MRIRFALVLIPFFAVLGLMGQAQAAAPQAEWTFLVYLNGNNNLDSFGSMDLNEMEKVGSTDKVNVVVQWASLQAQTVRRVLIRKDTDDKTVTSPVVQDMGRVDMGDWHSLVDFIEWGAKNYPAKHYFVDIWDHGSGWHAKSGMRISPKDISWDDLTGNFMTTQQLGQALNTAAQSIGQKIDIYGSDACLMSMVEIADEMSAGVSYYVGSEEVEPGEGWPYDALLARWVAHPAASPADVSKILTEEYVKSYEGGSQGTRDVTFSAFDLSQLGTLNDAVAKLGTAMQTFDAADRKKVTDAAEATEYFTYRDYGDLVDFLNILGSAGVTRLDPALIQNVKTAAGGFVIANATTQMYARAKGVAIWLPSDKSTYDYYSQTYGALQFNAQTHWSQALSYVLQDSTY